MYLEEIIADIKLENDKFECRQDLIEMTQWDG